MPETLTTLVVSRRQDELRTGQVGWHETLNDRRKHNEVDSYVEGERMEGGGIEHDWWAS